MGTTSTYVFLKVAVIYDVACVCYILLYTMYQFATHTHVHSFNAGPQSVDSYAIFLRSTGLCGHFETLVTDPVSAMYININVL